MMETETLDTNKPSLSFIESKKENQRFKINTNLVTLKLTLFFLYGATSSLVPYLTIHMQNIGLTMEEIALIYLALPFTTFAAPPITGYLVDKFGRYKPVVIVSFICTAALHHSLLLLPHQETPGVVPPAYVITHPKKLYVEVWWSPCPSRECPENEELDVVLDMCVDHCLLHKVNHRKHLHVVNTNIIYNMKNRSKPSTITTTRMTVEHSQSELVLESHHTKNINDYKNASIKVNSTQFTLDMHPNLGDPIEQFGIDLDSAEDDDNVMDYKKRFKGKLLKKHGVNVTELDENDLRCGGVVLFTANVYNTTGNNKKHYFNSVKQRLNYTVRNCIVQKCEFISGGPRVCPPDYNKSDDQIFWIYFTIRFLATVMLNAGMTIMDPIALTMIEKYGGDFGKEKLFSSLGMALFSPITGALIDINTRSAGYTDYSAAFYTYDILLMVSAFCVYLMPLGTKLPSDNIFRDLRHIFRMVHVVIFIVFLYVLGNLWGFIESFLFFYLKDLGAPNYLLGITVTVGTVSSIPFLYGADNITRCFGHINVVIVAFFAHAARLVGYSLIENAWWCFPFEALESISVHMMWVAAATYCATLAPKGLLATLIGVIGMAHFSIGRGSGSFIGGHIIGKFGIRQAFRLMGLVAVISGVLYGALQYFWLRNVDKDDYNPDEDKLKYQDEEPRFKDQSTMVSFERLSLMIEYNQVGSLSSLGRFRDRNSYIIRARSNSIRRGSSSGVLKGSRSKASRQEDLLKSAGEMSISRASIKKNSSHGYLNYSSLYSTNSGNVYNSSDDHNDKTIEKFLVPNETDEILYANKDESQQQSISNIQ